MECCETRDDTVVSLEISAQAEPEHHIAHSRRKLTFIGADGAYPEVISNTDRVIEEIAVNREVWAAYTTAAESWHAWPNDPWASSLFFVLPWGPMMIPFLPFLPFESLCRSRYVEPSVPASLTISAMGVRGGSAWGIKAWGIAWNNIDVEAMTIEKTVEHSCCVFSGTAGNCSGAPRPPGAPPGLVSELACFLGIGLLAPCCTVMLSQTHVPGYYTMLIPTKSTTVREEQVVPELTLRMQALSVDADRVLQIIKQGAADANAEEGGLPAGWKPPGQATP